MTSSNDSISWAPAFPTGDCQYCERAESLQQSSVLLGEENIPVPAARQLLGTALVHQRRVRLY